ncbi:Uncharacterised protein [Cedecea neteri]|uniref:Uncharacterized protein n=1 Tax=Cedecea neteri TaxID=158822 RepID=A0A2X3J6G6_9ENTR|nr:Uncharacterised protein [Cedecea neteri]
MAGKQGYKMVERLIAGESAFAMVDGKKRLLNSNAELRVVRQGVMESGFQRGDVAQPAALHVLAPPRLAAGRASRR